MTGAGLMSVSVGAVFSFACCTFFIISLMASDLPRVMILAAVAVGPFRDASFSLESSAFLETFCPSLLSFRDFLSSVFSRFGIKVGDEGAGHGNGSTNFFLINVAAVDEGNGK